MKNKDNWEGWKDIDEIHNLAKLIKLNQARIVKDPQTGKKYTKISTRVLIEVRRKCKGYCEECDIKWKCEIVQKANIKLLFAFTLMD
jgi:hypothetical protein